MKVTVIPPLELMLGYIGVLICHGIVNILSIRVYKYEGK